MSWANFDLNQKLIYFKELKDVLDQEKKKQEKMEQVYEQRIADSPVMEQLQVMATSYDNTADVPATGVQVSSGATIVGSMTGTGEGYSWTNAPGRIVTAGEQLTIPIATGIAVATAVTPAGMLIALGTGAWRAAELPWWSTPND